MKKCQELGHDTFHRIGNINLITVKLYLVLLNLHIVFQFREVQNTCKIERIVNVQVNVEQWIIGKRIQVMVEFLILFIFDLRRLSYP